MQSKLGRQSPRGAPGKGPATDLLGAHVSVAGGVFHAPGRAAALPAAAFQIFTKNQNQWRGKPLTDEAVARWNEELTRFQIQPGHVCSHDSYLINLAATNQQTRRRSLAALVDEIERCARLGIGLLVLHPGSHLGAGEAAGLRKVARNLDRCLEEAGAGPVPGTAVVDICLETTAGQGTNLGYRFAHLREIIADSRHGDRLQVCLDTCHVFAAGYSLTNRYQIGKTLAALDTAVGLERVKVLHLNDAKRECGSRVDRHARIGRGFIGREPFRLLLRKRRLAGALKILEVPGGEQAFAEDLALLRRLRKPRRR